MTGPRTIQAPPPQLRNVPMRPRAWRALLETPGTAVAEREGGMLALVPQDGQLHLYWAFEHVEQMRTKFLEMFEELRPQITPESTDYVVLDLVEVHGKEWVEPLLQGSDFAFFAEWMEMTHPGIDPNSVPEFPADVTMRKAAKKDLARVRELWSEAYGDLADGARTIDAQLAAASWVGVLERDGEIVGFAANGDVDDGEGHILAVAVVPDERRKGYGRLLLEAASYQLSTRDARRASIVARPDIPYALRTASAAGFRPGRGGLEYRRTSDEAEIARSREERRFAGVKARFGDWR
jgi:ribosomal protein S18 acetylase RimI-like enzyme